MNARWSLELEQGSSYMGDYLEMGEDRAGDDDDDELSFELKYLPSFIDNSPSTNVNGSCSNPRGLMLDAWDLLHTTASPSIPSTVDGYSTTTGSARK
ncbi:hypothetical protein AB1N83_006866 [Pleurotus pulmonarius]